MSIWEDCLRKMTRQDDAPRPRGVSATRVWGDAAAGSPGNGAGPAGLQMVHPPRQFASTTTKLRHQFRAN